jgi:probable HAF family extracellular repeat protein
MYSIVPWAQAVKSHLYGINNNGQMVGYLEDTSNQTHGLLYQNDVVNYIDAPNALATVLISINNNGQILGSYLDNAGSHYFIYDNGNFTGIDISVTALTGINDNGVLTGFDGNRALIAVSGVPVPASLWLFGSALTGMGLMRKKQRAA